MAFAPASDSESGSLRLVFAVSGQSDDSGLPPSVAVRLAVPAVDPGKALKLSVDLSGGGDSGTPTLTVRVTIVDTQAGEATVSETAAPSAATSNTLAIVTPLDVPTTSAPAPTDSTPATGAEAAPVVVSLPVGDDGVTPDQSVLIPTGRDAPLTVTVGADPSTQDPSATAQDPDPAQP